MQPLHVLFVNRFYHPQGKAGPAFTVRVLAEQLIAEGDRASVLCFNADHGRVEETVNGVRVYRLPAQQDWIAASPIVEEILQSARPSIVHTHWVAGFDLSGLGRLIKNTGARFVHTIHECSFICKKGTMFRNGRSCDTVCDECVVIRPEVMEFVSQIDAVTSVSGYTLERHEERSILDGISGKHVIHNPASPVMAPSTGEYVTDGSLSVGFLGRVIHNKGVEQLMEELTRFGRKRTVRLLIAGECQPHYRRYLLERFSDLNMRFLGFVSHEELFPNIDVLAVPSILRESLPRAIIEAYANGIPVIASNSGGIPEVIDVGVTGLLVDPDRKGEICDALERLLSNEGMIRRMGTNALKKAKEFSPANALAKYRRIYAQGSDSAFDR